MATYLARIFYLGTHYHGSQWQPNVPTIHGEVCSALAQWTRSDYPLDGVSFSGRTDKGVSSIGQVFSFDSNALPNIDKINSFLPEDIVIWAYCAAPNDFVPRYHILARHYRYFLDSSENKYNIGRMKEAARHLVGTHDFALLSKPDNNRNTVSTLLNIAISEIDFAIVVDIYGIRFLWKLVRKIITLLELIGSEEYPPYFASELIHNRNPIPGGLKPAPAEGLVLMESIVPLRMKKSKNAIAAIKRKIRTELAFYRTLTTTLKHIDGVLPP